MLAEKAATRRNTIPNITIDCPQINDIGKKRELIKAVTVAAEKAYSLPKQAMVIIIKENSPENVGIGGELLADGPRRETGASNQQV